MTHTERKFKCQKNQHTPMQDHRTWLDDDPVSHMDPKYLKKTAPIASKMDTQGMSGPADPNYKPTGKQEYIPATVTPRRLHTHQMVKELKIIINEVLDEREGKMDYTSYFDTDKYKHTVLEEEPPYRP